MPRTRTRQEEVKEETDNPYLVHPAKILDFRRQTADCFVIKTNFKAKHNPGQFVQMSLPGIGEAPISIASYSDEFMEFSIREVGNLTNAIGKLKKGDAVYIRGPYGRGYPVEKFFGKDLILVGGGSGVAPLKGLLAYIDQHNENFGEVNLFFGFRSPDNILFKDDLKRWKKKYKLNMSVDVNPGKAKISCDVCFITQLLEKAKMNPENKVVFICGPPVMMKISVGILKNKGFQEDQIYISTERMMNCGVGVCGHCMIHGKYTCKDGPVFRYDEISKYKSD